MNFEEYIDYRRFIRNAKFLHQTQLIIMPNYEFKDENEKIIVLYCPMLSAPKIGEKIKDKEYGTLIRIASIPQTGSDHIIDPFDKKKFLEKTNKPGNMGDIFDFSRDLHKQREQITGKDEIKEKFVEKSKKRRKGKFIDRTD